MKRLLGLLWIGLVVSCTHVESELHEQKLVLRRGQTTVTLVFPSIPSQAEVEFLKEVFRRLSDLERPSVSREIPLVADPYQNTFLIGQVILQNWKNLTLRWAWIQQIWEDMRWEAVTSSRPWTPVMKETPLSFTQVRDFASLFQKYQLTGFQIREARKYLIQFLSVEVYFVSLQELMERYGRYYTMNDLPTVFFQVVVLPESVEWLEFLQGRYGRGTIRRLARLAYDKQVWEKKLGKPVSDLESEFVKGLEGRRFTTGIWASLDFVHEYQNLLTLYNQSTKSTLFKK